MWLTAILAGALGGAAAVPNALPVNQIAPVGVEARFIQRPSASEYTSVYPPGARDVGMPGHVALDCGVKADGLLERCKVTREMPEGAGFGAAAVALARFFRLDSESAAAAAGDFRFSIGFASAVSEDSQLTIGPWLAAPSFADAGAVYPDIGGGVTGEVFMRCELARDGELKACKALYERPIDRDFDAAALKLAHFFRMQIDPAALRSSLPLSANVLVRLAAPFEDESKQRRIADPVWLSAPSLAQLSRLFPAQAAAKGVIAGTGDVDCTVAADGSLVDCLADGEGNPPNLGFADAALKAAAMMRMSPWTDDGGPVDGARIHLPIRFTSSAQ